MTMSKIPFASENTKIYLLPCCVVAPVVTVCKGPLLQLSARELWNNESPNYSIVSQLAGKLAAQKKIRVAYHVLFVQQLTQSTF